MSKSRKVRTDTDRYLDGLKKILEHDMNTYHDQVRPGGITGPLVRLAHGLSQKSQFYFNLKKEYKDYLKIIDNKKLTADDKITQLKEHANKMVEKQEKRPDLVGGGMHGLIQDINVKAKYSNSEVNKFVEEISPQQPKAEHDRRHSAPAAGLRNQGLFKLDDSVTRKTSMPANYHYNSQTKQASRYPFSDKDDCFKVLQDIVDMSAKLGLITRSDHTRYSEIIRSPINNEDKAGELITAVLNRRSSSHDSFIHQKICDVDPTNQNYVSDIMSIRKKLFHSLEKKLEEKSVEQPELNAPKNK